MISWENCYRYSESVDMSATAKKKLCWNCEGRVDLEQENCPYCAVYLGPAPDDDGGRTDNILAPPYKLVEAEEQDEEIPASPYTIEEEKEAVEETVTTPSEDSTEMRKTALPLAFLSGGVIFFLFGLVLLIFSNEGTFTLQWNGEYWYFYLGFALPLLFVGWKTLLQVDDQPENENF